MMDEAISGIIDRFKYRKKRKKLIQRQVGYAILLSDEVHNFMRGLQVLILNQCVSASGMTETPHITLKQAFEVKSSEPFEQYFDRLVHEIEPFEIVIKGVDSFPDRVIFLDVEQDTRLETLRLKILRDLSEKFGIKPHPLEDERYYFHATLAYNISKEDFKEARQTFKEIRADFRFIFDTLGLMYFTGAEWMTYKRLKVGGKS